MRRTWIIILCGLLLGAAAFAVPYFSRTSKNRLIADSSEPGLTWLKTEFNLSDAEFARACALHRGYQPECRRLCALVADKDAELHKLISATNRVTPEIERVLKEKADLRRECQTKMLAHFYAVSQTMQPEQGRRYLAWVQNQTLEGATMPHESGSKPGGDSHHGH